MITANDLRIGNYILGSTTRRWSGNGSFKEFNKTHIVTGINEKGIYATYGSGKTLVVEAEPIPLTEEILLKAGWLWNEECNSYEKHPDGDARLNISKPSEISGKRTVFNYVIKAKIADVTYLHQLQNLYFSLTNKELNITL